MRTRSHGQEGGRGSYAVESKLQGPTSPHSIAATKQDQGSRQQRTNHKDEDEVDEKHEHAHPRMVAWIAVTLSAQAIPCKRIGALRSVSEEGVLEKGGMDEQGGRALALINTCNGSLMQLWTKAHKACRLKAQHHTTHLSRRSPACRPHTEAPSPRLCTGALYMKPRDLVARVWPQGLCC